MPIKKNKDLYHKIVIYSYLKDKQKQKYFLFKKIDR